jgi:hypothetical protein
MNKITQTLLILPLVTLTTLGCEAKPNIVTGPNPIYGNGQVTVNCDDRTILEDGQWLSRVDYPGFERLHDLGVKSICES